MPSRCHSPTFNSQYSNTHPAYPVFSPKILRGGLEGLAPPATGHAETISRVIYLTTPPPSEKRLQPGLRAPKDQRVDVVRPLIGVHRLKVHHVTDDLEFFGYSVAAVHVTRHPRNLQRLDTVVAFDDADHLRRGPGFVHQPPHTQRRLLAQRNLGLHVGQL